MPNFLFSRTTDLKSLNRISFTYFNSVHRIEKKYHRILIRNWYNKALMITEKVLLCGNTLMKCCCGATLYFLRQRARSNASNFILCLELF